MAALTSLFKRLGYTSVNSFYANRLSLLRYPDDLLQAMRERGLAYTKARVLTRIKDPEIRQGLTETTLHDNLSVEPIPVYEPGGEADKEIRTVVEELLVALEAGADRAS